MQISISFLKQTLLIDILPLALAAEVLDVVGVLGGKLLKLRVEGTSDTSLIVVSKVHYRSSRRTYALLNQVVLQDLLDDGLAHNHTGWVTNPTKAVSNLYHNPPHS